MRAPCYDHKTHTDCPRRAVGCRATCEAWRAYEAAKAEELEARKQAAERREGVWEHFARVRKRKQRRR